MSIQCNDIEQFMDVIAGLVRRGLTFKAHASTLLITLTGGH